MLELCERSGGIGGQSHEHNDEMARRLPGAPS